MKIAYLSIDDPNDVHGWSGITRSMGNCLAQDGSQVIKLGPLPPAPTTLAIKLRFQMYHRLLREAYWAERDPSVAKHYAHQAAELLNAKAPDADIVFAPSTIPIAHLECRQPIVFWTDAAFAGMVGFYHNARNLSRRTIRNGNRLEQAALDRCRLALYASQWAADSAIKNYRVDPAKVKVVAMGANLSGLSSSAEAEQTILNRPTDRCNLILIGVDWIRKGVDFAIQVAQELNTSGLPTQLTVIGCHPPPPRIVPDFVHVLGFISKATDDGRNRLRELLSQSHFLILPSEAEAAGLVFAEASAMAVPSLATRVGGIGTMVRDGINGQTFPLDIPPPSYATYIREMLADPSRYHQLCQTSLLEYQSRLNWDAAGRAIGNLLALIPSQ
jgi:glycosyltransferase involved in cell wall biosynthesis